MLDDHSFINQTSAQHVLCAEPRAGLEECTKWTRLLHSPTLAPITVGEIGRSSTSLLSVSPFVASDLWVREQGLKGMYIASQATKSEPTGTCQVTQLMAVGWSRD